ncbi:hypothetical protein K438DRAFT_1786440 [Mycena galopus ATCC 62051]|nr:hypothetical protein K438DRAFT_1786440 [Mycena galopus ATCC 62051]
MSDHLIDPGEVLISLVTAALTAAEADAAAPDAGLIFRPEWRPTRSSTSQTQGRPGANRSSSYASVVRNQGPRSGLQQDQLLLSPGPHAKRTPSSAYAPPPVSASVSPPPAASAPALSLLLGHPPPPPPQPQFQEDAVAELVKKNQDVFDKVLNHPFPQALGMGTASLDGFRYYMIVVCSFTIAGQQDKLYLETCAALKMMAFAASPSIEDIKDFGVRHKSSLKYVENLEKICSSMLGIPESTMNTIPRSVELDASEHFYKDSLRNEDALLGYYIVLLPCVLTYWKIAERLMNDPSTVKNVVYHPAWTVVNYDSSSVGKYTTYQETPPQQFYAILSQNCIKLLQLLGLHKLA